VESAAATGCWRWRENHNTYSGNVSLRAEKKEKVGVPRSLFTARRRLARRAAFCNQLEDWHSEECKLTPALTFDLLIPNKMADQDLSCTIHLPSSVMMYPVVFVLEC